MKRIVLKAAVLLILMARSVPVCHACTSLIVSSEASATGRPFMFKNRDSSHLDNRVAFFQGPRFSFIGIENVDSVLDEVWSGTNSAGFSIMNTASYNFKEDDLPENMMDREGVVMKKALGICETVDDFENLLRELPKPLGVETNFGVIDAHGGAAYFECNNTRWVRFDVASEPSGYMVVTNFCRSGKPELVRGYERYLTASAIMAEMVGPDGGTMMSHDIAINSLSRSYRHKLLGTDYVVNYELYKQSSSFNGLVVDQDFIPRHSTASIVAFEGVAEGEDPSKSVMWTLLGYPSCGVYVPLLVSDHDILPAYMKASSESGHSVMSDMAMRLKERYVFPHKVSSGDRYVSLENVLKGSDKKPALVLQCRKIENFIDSLFAGLYEGWRSGKISDAEFYDRYVIQTSLYYEKYRSEMAPFWD